MKSRIRGFHGYGGGERKENFNFYGEFKKFFKVTVCAGGVSDVVSCISVFQINFKIMEVEIWILET